LISNFIEGYLRANSVNNCLSVAAGFIPAQKTFLEAVKTISRINFQLKTDT
jgi:hypothetical protein